MSETGLRIEGLKSALAGPFDLRVERGRSVAIVGPSGAGKSLLLRLIADLDPGEGAVGLDGIERRTLSGPAWRRRVPHVAAESGWWAPTPADHFAQTDLTAASALAGRLGLASALMQAPVERLSTGERQRLALVRALVLAPAALLLDEPTGPLDPVATTAVETILAERLAAGALLILVSHDPAQAQRLGARTLVMRERRLEAAS